MKHAFFSIMTAVFVAATPLFAQQSDSEEEGQEQVEAKTGVRFVNCSTSGAQIPDPLFCKMGNSYRQIRIAQRVPSPRVKPAGGVIEFYDEDPTPAKDEKDKGKAGKDKSKGGKGKAKGGEEEIKPVMSVQVPGDFTSGKSLCILRPIDVNTKPYKVESIFVSEGKLPKSGVHIINMTSTPLVIKTSQDPNFPDNATKQETIPAMKEGKTATIGSNVWSVNGANEQEVSFILFAQGKSEKDLRRIKASRFSISGNQAQINIVVADPKRPNSFTMQTIQLADPKDKSAKDKGKGKNGGKR